MRREMGDSLGMVQVDLEDAFCTDRFDAALSALEQALGPRRHPTTQTASRSAEPVRLGSIPHWSTFAPLRVRARQRCRCCGGAWSGMSWGRVSVAPPGPGVNVPSVAVGRDTGGVRCTECVCDALTTGWLSHSTGANYFVLVAEKREKSGSCVQRFRCSCTPASQSTRWISGLPQARNK